MSISGAGVYDHSQRRLHAPPAPGPPKAKRVKKAALAAGFASANHYHFLTEVLPAAVVLRLALEFDAALRLVVPKLSAARRAWLALVLPEAVLENAVELPAGDAPGPGPRGDRGREASRRVGAAATTT